MDTCRASVGEYPDLCVDAATRVRELGREAERVNQVATGVRRGQRLESRLEQRAIAR